MLAIFRRFFFFFRYFDRSKTKAGETEDSNFNAEVDERGFTFTMAESAPEGSFVPYDENLLDRARMQWQFGDWESLSQINRESIQHHPDRAKLALLAAAGRMQIGKHAEGKSYIRLAQDWRISRRLISQILIAGVHNSIARAAALDNQQHRALKHFEKAIFIGMPSGDPDLLIKVRAGDKINKLNNNQSISNNNNKYIPRRQHYIKAGYKPRAEYVHYKDIEEDKFQLEVYLRAYGLMRKNNWNTVADIGCGSAYKLVTYLGDFETIGYELPDNVEALKRRYPERDWRVSRLDDKEELEVDLIICSDVIEHLVDPDALMNHLAHQSFRKLILSTPERDICRGVNDFGPPDNPAHQREWSFEEFGLYVSSYFNIVEHAISNNSQGTQFIICEKRINSHINAII